MDEQSGSPKIIDGINVGDAAGILHGQFKSAVRKNDGGRAARSLQAQQGFAAARMKPDRMAPLPVIQRNHHVVRPQRQGNCMQCIASNQRQITRKHQPAR